MNLLDVKNNKNVQFDASKAYLSSKTSSMAMTSSAFGSDIYCSAVGGGFWSLYNTKDVVHDQL